MLATTAVASVALSQSLHNVGFVNQLSNNVSMAFETQEDTDGKMEHTLNALYDVVQCLGDELQSLKSRAQLKCPANYECVTASVYIDSVIGWERVKVHL